MLSFQSIKKTEVPSPCVTTPQAKFARLESALHILPFSFNPGCVARAPGFNNHGDVIPHSWLAAQATLLDGEPPEEVDYLKHIGSMLIANGQGTE